MFKILKYFLFFVVCLLVALMFTLPVQYVLPWVTMPNTIQLSGVDGTLLRGKADQVTIDDFPIRSITYRYRPSCIPLLKVCYKIEYDRGDIRVAYDLLHGDTVVNKALIEYQASELMVHVPNAIVQPTGRLELIIDELTLIDGKPSDLSGKLIWRDMGIDDEGIKIDIGDYQLDFTGDSKKYDFKLSDLDASLEVNGAGEVIAGGQYNYEIKIESKSSLDPQVKYVLDAVAQNISYNKYRIEQSGQLPPNITRQLF